MNWTRSSKCDGGTCVEVTFENGPTGWPTVGVRNSRSPADVVWFTQAEWAAFVAGVRSGDFDAETDS
jgi:hypothetical protein